MIHTLAFHLPAILHHWIINLSSQLKVLNEQDEVCCFPAHWLYQQIWWTMQPHSWKAFPYFQVHVSFHMSLPSSLSSLVWCQMHTLYLLSILL